MRFYAVGQIDSLVRVRLAPDVSVFLRENALIPAPNKQTFPRLDRTSNAWQWRLTDAAGLPFVLKQTGTQELTLTLYGSAAAPLPDDFLQQVDSRLSPHVSEWVMKFDTKQLWGFHARYDGSDLVLEVKKAPEPHDIIVTLDAGHGGRETGGAGAFGVPEKDLVLPITLRIAELLQAAGVTVYLIREDDRTLGLYDRVLMAEEINSHLLVSIHANALPDGKNPRGIRGPEVYYTHLQAETVAASILNQIREDLPELGHGSGLIPDANLALTRPSQQISVLVEMGYLTDPNNLRVLMSPEGKEALAQAISQGIMKWIQP